jgi:type I restriction enzyme S subunit
MEATKVVYKKKTLAPKLRFKEFDGSYEKHFFKDIFLFSTGKNIKQNEASPEFEIPCVRYGELYHMYNEVIKEIFNRTNLDRSELLFSQGNEILLPSAGEDPLDIGSASALLISNVAIGRTINILKPLKDNIYSQIYVAYYINQKLRKKISTLAKGVSISNVYNSDLKTLDIILPNLPEQKKIAGFLSAVDEKIQLLNRKKQLLEQYKKGLMQQLFSGKLRFKDENGKAFPKWEEKKLGILTDIVVGGTPSTNIPEYWDGAIPWLSSGELKNGEVNQALKFITELGLQKSSTKLMPKGTVLLAMTGATLGRIGFLTFESSGNQSIAGFLPKSSYNSKYLFYNLQFNFQYILSFAGGAAQPGINKNTIENLQLSFPVIEEQKKIANFLSGIDVKLEALGAQISQSQTFKKGLLQQMFV